MGPRVLAFADGRDSLVAACRLHAPLAALRNAGLIDDYVVTDATLRGAPPSGLFDVVWLQRGASAALARLVASRLPGRYLLDVDDHLLCMPSYLKPGDMPSADALTEALAECRVLTVPSLRLATRLERRAGVPLGARSRACPNAVAFGEAPLREPRRPAAILLTQGHRLALTASQHEVLGAIATFAARRKLSLWYLGSPPAAFLAVAASTGAHSRGLRPRSYVQYHSSLATGPVLLGVAPLESRGDSETNEFVSGKSDIKMVEYGGVGHPAVYSRVAPYVDTNLACGRLAGNENAAWKNALNELYSDGWRAVADEQRSVRDRRSLESVITESWWPAIEEARLEDPVDASKLLREVDRVRAQARNGVARTRWHLRLY